MTFSEAIEKFLLYLITVGKSNNTASSYKQSLMQFLSFLHRKYNSQIYLDEVTATDVEAYLHYLLTERGYAPASRRKDLISIRSFYNFCHKKGLVQQNVAAMVDTVTTEQKERPYLSKAEFEQLVDTIQEPLIKLVIQCLFYTGLRISELLNLTLQDVDLDKCTIMVRLGKGAKDRIIPISQELKPLLTDYLTNWREKVGTDKFFCTKTGHLSAEWVRNRLRDASERAGFKIRVTPHILRHSFASALVKNQVNIVKIQKLLGHSSLKTTSIYCHTNIEDLEEAVNLL